MKSIFAIIAAIATLNLIPHARAAEPAPAPAAEVKSAATLEDVMAKLRDLDRQMAEIIRRLDSISVFLGDKQSSGFSTVDRRLEDLRRDVEDIKRDIERMH